MPSHAISDPQGSTDELKAAVHGRLDELERLRPDLIPAVQLQRTLLDRELDLLGIISAGGLPALSLPPRYVAAKLGRGIPALHGEPVPLPGKLLELAARDFCERLAAGGAGERASAVGRAFEARTPDPAAVLSACFARDQRRVRALASAQNLVPDLVWLAAELALAPFVHLLQHRLFDDAPEALSCALREWNRGFCPACGSWPAIIDALAGTHVLRCSFCAAGWTLTSYRCLYCGNDGETFLTAAPDAERLGQRLQACGGCGAYVKVIDVTRPTRFPLVAVEDLATMNLDMAAIERKYLRPPLPEIKRL